jgi:hypothetical protein
LRCQTGLVNCPYGISEDGKLMVTLYPGAITVLNALDDLIKDIAQNMELEHVPLSVKDSVLVLNVNRTRVNFFDNNRVKISMDEVSGAEFTAYILLDLSKPYIYDGKIKMSIMLLQVLVRTFSNLPPGCHIFNSLADLRTHIKQQSAHQDVAAMECESSNSGSGSASAVEAEADNELLD